MTATRFLVSIVAGRKLPHAAVEAGTSGCRCPIYRGFLNRTLAMSAEVSPFHSWYYPFQSHCALGFLGVESTCSRDAAKTRLARRRARACDGVEVHWAKSSLRAFARWSLCLNRIVPHGVEHAEENPIAGVHGAEVELVADEFVDLARPDGGVGARSLKGEGQGRIGALVPFPVVSLLFVMTWTLKSPAVLLMSITSTLGLKSSLWLGHEGMSIPDPDGEALQQPPRMRLALTIAELRSR